MSDRRTPKRHPSRSTKHVLTARPPFDIGAPLPQISHQVDTISREGAPKHNQQVRDRSHRAISKGGAIAMWGCENKNFLRWYLLRTPPKTFVEYPTLTIFPTVTVLLN